MIDLIRWPFASDDQENHPMGRIEFAEETDLYIAVHAV
jgi:hypothetical protein